MSNNPTFASDTENVIVASLFLPYMPSLCWEDGLPVENLDESLSLIGQSPSPKRRRSALLGGGSVSAGGSLRRKQSRSGGVSGLTSLFTKANVSDAATNELSDNTILHSPVVMKSRRGNRTRTQSAQPKWNIVSSPLGNIGLQNAVKSVSSEVLTKTWVGTVGAPMDTLEPEVNQSIIDGLKEKNCVDVGLSFDDLNDGYHGFCKQLLWPLLHSKIPQYNTKYSVTTKDGGHKIILRNLFEKLSWEGYQRINRKFADAICSIYKEGDIIWVHDYHLMLLPSLLRERLPNAIIGFFLHVPFPSSEIFRCLFVRKEILEGVLGADLCGFQTYSFARHFLQTSSRILCLESTPKFLQLENTVVSVGIFPMGINTATLEEKMHDASVISTIHALEEKYQGKKIIVARDKLDPVKGVRQKMLAFELFLEMHPEWVGKVGCILVLLLFSYINKVD